MFNEAEYRGKEVELNKPKHGDVKKYTVYVNDPKTNNVKKVNFGDPNMEIKRDDLNRRKSFRARHKCDTAKDKTTPRYWSCKFWSNKKVSELLKEIIEPSTVDITSIKFNDTLSPEIWDSNNKMISEIRKVLLMNAKRFIEFCDIQNLKFNDITLTGSMANYNYNEQSDLDIHIILDLTQISENIEFVNDFFKLKKQLWSNELPIKVKNHDVELYLQDINELHHSTGVYSLMNNDWISKPIKKIINLDVSNIKLKSSDLMNSIDDLEDNLNDEDFLEKHKNLKDKIKKYRQSGLDENGEYSIENLVFKVLRNNGYLEKLAKLKEDYLTNELSLDEYYV
jgi:hypothetical protein